MRDKARFAEHWDKSLDRWFPQGIDTPGMVMIEVDANRIHYWDGEDEGEVKLHDSKVWTEGPWRRTLPRRSGRALAAWRALPVVAGYFHLHCAGAVPEDHAAMGAGTRVWSCAHRYGRGARRAGAGPAVVARGCARAAGIGLALYALCVWPANFQHMTLDLAHPDQGSGWPITCRGWLRSR